MSLQACNREFPIFILTNPDFQISIEAHAMFSL